MVSILAEFSTQNQMMMTSGRSSFNHNQFSHLTLEQLTFGFFFHYQYHYGSLMLWILNQKKNLFLKRLNPNRGVKKFNQENHYRFFLDFKKKIELKIEKSNWFFSLKKNLKVFFYRTVIKWIESNWLPKNKKDSISIGQFLNGKIYRFSNSVLIA